MSIIERNRRPIQEYQQCHDDKRPSKETVELYRQLDLYDQVVFLENGQIIASCHQSRVEEARKLLGLS